MIFVADTKWIQLLFSIFCIAYGVPGPPYSSEGPSYPGYQQPSNYPQRPSYPERLSNEPQESSYPKRLSNEPQESSEESSEESSNSGPLFPSDTGSSQRQRSSICRPDAREPWSYEYQGTNGPNDWSSRYRNCSGRMQSPIAINSNAVMWNNDLPKLAMKGYNIPISRGTIQNNGHSVTLTPEDKTRRTILVDGSTYSLSQIHFHWGDTSNHGAEHTMDGQSYTMETHFVHNRGNKVAVVSSFFQEQTYKNPALQPIVERLSRVSYKDQKIQLSSSLDLSKLVPENPASYFRYAGSLTTPGCDEGVIWSLLYGRILPVGKEQMKEFRKLFTVKRSEATQLSNASCRLVNNYRSVQPLNRRQVFRSL